MLYGADYHSAANRDDGRRLRRFRRDVMFLAARPPEVVAAGLVAGLAVLPVVLAASLLLTLLFYAVFSGGPASGGLPAHMGLTDQPAPTSRADILAVLVVGALTLAAAGAAGAALRRRDYLRQGGFHYYLHHPRSPLGLAGFFAPVTGLVVAGLLRTALGQPRLGRPDMLVAAPSLLDRGVLYLFLGVTLSGLLYMVWEACFPAILPTLSDLDVDAEVARLQRDDAARIQAEEDRLRGIAR